MIMALDLATQTGLCIGAPDARPALSHFRLPSTGTDVGLFLSAWEDWLRPQVREVGPSLIVFEAPILAGQTQIATTRKLQGMAGVTEMVAHRAGIECAEVATSQVKKALTGNGRAEKPAMMAACRAYGFDPKTSDEADAFGIWLCAVRFRHPSHAWRWEPLNAARTA
ncbi:crossover junction endodeoxyribonuclease RuvC [Brevundimonas diminuta]|uniref:crossover junction endodeoxyribonuclease RuvC n=1 Tax=Brevundimonas diminuta TaxID=293 RepID=UPI002096C2D1|nr:crossover junction endodeoxyribonuclease RuvC [Brevundimonas diminuta]MCO8017520.1 crossover junction endodeoxyribonuclease RuvC [Brevundimonas diminuta]MCO8021040.1 crossover junction endodeoxyribonuclease RuvC [Brevundimonas diminuta]